MSQVLFVQTCCPKDASWSFTLCSCLNGLMSPIAAGLTVFWHDCLISDWV